MTQRRACVACSHALSTHQDPVLNRGRCQHKECPCRAYVKPGMERAARARAISRALGEPVPALGDRTLAST